MIDYDKLKIAHELCQKLNGDYYANFIMSAHLCEYNLNDTKIQIEDNPFFITESIDDFIAKLEELTGEKPKYKYAWYLSTNNRIPLCTKVCNQECYVACEETDIECFGKIMYPSKEALIDAQIEYWLCLKNEEKSTGLGDMSK